MSDTTPRGITRRTTMAYGAALAAGAAVAGTFSPAGTASAAAAPTVTFAFSDPAGLYVVDGSGQAKPELVVTVTSAAALSGTVTWAVLARGTEPVHNGQTAFDAPAGSPAATTIALGALGVDHYAVTVTVTDRSGTQLATTRLGLGVLRPAVSGLRPGSAFGLGIRPESSPAITKRIAQLMGVKWTRGVISVQPDTVCPSPGVFWGQSAIDVARAEIAEWRGYGIEPLGFINYNMSWNVEPGPNGPVQVYQNRPHDLAAHAEMVYHAIAPLQDLVKYWELWNEPWVHGWAWMTGDAQDYRDMVKLIWDRVKPDFPDVKLIGGGSVTYNRDIVYAKGSTDTGYIDGSVNHAYGYPDATQYAMTKTQIRLDKQGSRSGGSGGQWQTELGTNPTASFPHLPKEEANYAVARTVAPTYLLHMLAGAEESSPIRVFWFSLSYDKKYSGQEFNIYDIATRTPLPAVTAYAAMTSRLEDADLLTELYPDSRSTWGFLFRAKDGSGRAAVYADQIWDGTDEHPAAGYHGTLTLHDAYGIRVYDYLGRQLADGRSSTVTLAVNAWEVLYFEGTRTPDALRDALTTNATFAYDTPLVVTPLSLDRPVGAGTVLDVRVENTSPAAVDAILRMTAPTGWTLERTDVPVLKLAPGEQRTVHFPVTAYQVDGHNQYQVGWRATFPRRPGLTQRGTQTVRVAHMPYRTITVGGDAAQWATVVPVTMTSVSATGDRKDYVFRSAWDDTNWYLRAEIDDDLHVANDPFPRNRYLFPFKADSIQLAFDAVADKTEDLLAGDPHHDKCLRSLSHLYVATLAKGGVPELHRQCAPGTNYQTYYPTNAGLPTPLGPMDAHPTSGTEGRVQITRDETAKRTTYEIAIPWAQLPEVAAKLPGLRPGDVLPLAFAPQVTDAGTGGHGATYWTAQQEAPASGCYNFAPFWGTGAQFSGGRIDTRWGIGR